MIIALTGTPGTGKTTISSELLKNGMEIVDLHKFIEENGLMERFDRKRETHSVDIVKLNDTLWKKIDRNKDVFLDGHLSHFLDVDMIIVLRCNPSVLYERLKKRGYAPSKITENVQAEALDVILCEAVDSGKPVFEIDNTSSKANYVTIMIEEIIRGSTDDYVPGSVNWGEEMIKWF